MTASKIVKVLAINLLIWLSICTIGAAGNYQDNLRFANQAHHARSFVEVWLAWLNGHLPLFILSSLLYLSLLWRPRLLANARGVVRTYLVLACLFFPLHMLYIAIPAWQRKTGEHSLAGLIQGVIDHDNFTWFLEFAWFSGTFAVTLAVRIWHLSQSRVIQLQRTEQSNLELRLALEKQRLIILQQQLEPHFIFNALNAISALVRLKESSIALHGIHQLSALLRYALLASKRKFVTLDEEMRFISDYLGLQKLRYGDRLEFQYEGYDDHFDSFAHIACPPLLLQPLIENALRHDLDCHDECGRITIHFSTIESANTNALRLCVHNTRGHQVASNPGTGLGLVQTQERLAALYGSTAHIEVEMQEKYFQVCLTIPLISYDPDETVVDADLISNSASNSNSDSDAKENV
ncbi:histidine kinase [Undibacterium cyanobacteriorum]|uniref:Histidine kinase n=1 Tax=Undibacterium cyanobacteriorum TaxID=3073561 RepID=A0ABY9RDI0_9BURK|nr:histidine kinase [Undibacterium sp. 20NA77.5]WMW79297.1 histidine kinase [Undibacterium sp. 20NA77.5]